MSVHVAFSLNHRWVLFLQILLGIGCYVSHYGESSTGRFDEECSFPCEDGMICSQGRCCAPEKQNVDLLLVVDPSFSMEEEQREFDLALQELTRMVSSDDPEIDISPIDLHFGVISTDIGVDYIINAWCEMGLGDDGLLKREAFAWEHRECKASYPSFLRLDHASENPDFLDDSRCLSFLGAQGCGIQQPLEAILKALSPADSPMIFRGNTKGHADGANRGFLREDSTLAILILTNEDDCSMRDSEVLNPRSTQYSGPLNTRCGRFPHALHPLTRYLEGLLALREDPNRLFVSIWGGYPQDALPEMHEDPNIDHLLAHPDMNLKIDPTSSSVFVPSCRHPTRGNATPPRRLTEFVRELAQRDVPISLSSICSESYANSMHEMMQSLASRFENRCR